MKKQCVILAVFILLISVRGLAFISNCIAPYHCLTASILVLFFVVLILMLGAYQRRLPKIPDIEEVMKHQEIVRSIRVCNAWCNFSIVLLFVHYCLNLLSIYSSIVTAYIGSVAGNNKDIVLYSIMAITFLFVDLMLKPKEIAYGYRIAFEHSDRVLQRYFCELVEWNCVLDTMEECEELIGKSLFGMYYESKR